MECFEVDIEIVQGSVRELIAQFTNPDGTPFDFTGYTSRMQIRTDTADAGGTVLVDIDDSDGIDLSSQTLETEDGNIAVNFLATLTAEQTRACGGEIKGYYDVKFFIGDNEYTGMRGKVMVLPEVTRDE